MKTSIEDSKKWILKVSAEGKEYRYYYKPRPEYRNRGPSTYNRTCSVCGEKTTRIQPPKGHNRYPTALWLKDGSGGWKCWDCNNRENSRNQKYKQLRFTPNNKLYNYKTNLRRGICSICKKHRRTLLHHDLDKYYINNPLLNTIEICRSCHNSVTSLLKKGVHISLI